jgi:ABC-type transporter Mla maintaining outer membrane lipid asymmetry ATPase subunit MlaF
MKKKEWEGYRSKISYMFQNNALFDSMTVFENIALPLRQTTNMRKKEILKVMSGLIRWNSRMLWKVPAELQAVCRNVWPCAL